MTEANDNLPKIGIVGAGNVGSALTFALAGSTLNASFEICARNLLSAKAAVLDVAGAFPEKTKVMKTTSALSGRYDCIVVTAGVQHSPDQTKN